MKISLHLRSLCLAIGLSSMLVSPGCATFASDLTAFRSAIDVADMVIDAIDDFVNGYFAAHPDPEKQAKIKAAEAQARAAAAAALALANGAGDAKDGNVAQAFADFESAYSSLLALAQSLGVKAAAPGAKVGVQVGGGVLVVPAPRDLRPAMVKEVARPVALRSPAGPTEITFQSLGDCPGASVYGEKDGRMGCFDGALNWLGPIVPPPLAFTGDLTDPLTVTKPTPEMWDHQWDGHQWYRVRGGALVHWSEFEGGWDMISLRTDPVVQAPDGWSGTIVGGGTEVPFLSADRPSSSIILGIVEAYPESWKGPRTVFYSDSLPVSLAVPVGAEVMARERVGHSECDSACGKSLTGLATPSGCWCWRESKTDWRASRWVAVQ